MAEIEDYQNGSEEDDEEVIKKIVQREQDILNSVGSEKILDKINLNKLSNKEVTVVKKMMDQKFHQNQLRPGTPGYQYDIEKDFDPEESNEWDKSQSNGQLPKLYAQIPEMSSQKPAPKAGEKPIERPVHSKPWLGKPTQLGGADEEFDIDFEEDFNDDLDDFD